MSYSEQEMEEFKAEAFELLDVAEKSLLALDQGANFQPAFDAIFRCFHNVKGGCGMMELTQLQALTHELETIFMRFKGSTGIPKEYINMFLRGIDAARAMFADPTIVFNFKVSADVAVDGASSTAVKDPVEITSALAPALAPAQTVQAESSEPRLDLSGSTLDEFVSECEEIAERISKNLKNWNLASRASIPSTNFIATSTHSKAQLTFSRLQDSVTSAT